MLTFAGLGCQSSNSTSTSEVSRPIFTKFDDRVMAGVICQKYRIEKSGREIWFYQPRKTSSDTLILIPAISSNGISGGKLSSLDEMLATGFVQQGLAVAAYDVGEVAPLDADSIDDFKRAIHSVIDDGGLADAQNAIAIGSMESEKNRIVTLGQGSASSLALRAAVQNDRVDACVMIDPPVSIKSGTVEVVIDVMATSMPELGEFLKTDDFAPLVQRTRVPIVVVNVVHENASAGFESTEPYSARPIYDVLRASAMKIINPFPTDQLPDEGFVQISEWISRQPTTRSRSVR